MEEEDSNHLVEVEEKHSSLEVEAHCHSSFDSEVRKTCYQDDVRKDKEREKRRVKNEREKRGRQEKFLNRSFNG